MAREPKVPPEAVAYVRALLARAAALGVPAAALAMPLSRNHPGPHRPALQMRAAVAHAVARAGIWRSVFRLIPETADAETRMRDAAHRLELLTPQVEALIAALTRGLTYTPPPPLLPLSAPAAASYKPAAAIRGRPRGPKLRSALLDPWRYEDDPAAVAADLTGKAPSAPTWAPAPEEQGYGA